MLALRKSHEYLECNTHAVFCDCLFCCENIDIVLVSKVHPCFETPSTIAIQWRKFWSEWCAWCLVLLVKQRYFGHHETVLVLNIQHITSFPGRVFVFAERVKFVTFWEY